MAASGKVGVFGLGQTDGTLGHCRILLDSQPRQMVSQKVAFDIRHTQRIGRRFVFDLNRD